jgi:hypothetical protein
MGRLDVLIVLLLAAAIGGSVVGIALFSGGDEDGADSLASPSPTQAPVFSPSSPDELAIAALAQRSVEALPRGEWPALYDAFVPEFQQRCPRDEFELAGATNAADLGARLALIAYKHLQQLTISGVSASAGVAAEVRGESEYTIEAAFQRPDGEWKLAPAPNTTGCQAFTRLSG